MEALLFLVVSVLFGTTLAYLIPAALRLEDRLAIGAALGLAVMGLVTFLAAAIFGFSAAVIAAVIGLVLMGTGIIWWQVRLARQRLRDELRSLRKRTATSVFWLSAFVFFAIATLLTYLFSHTLFMQDGTVYAGFSNVWGDWSQHLAQTASFAYGDNFPPQLSTMSGQRLSYPFLTNFISAVMVKGGLSLLTAMKLPVWLLALSGLGLVITFARIVAGTAASLLSPLIFFLSGGLGFINFFFDWAHSHKPLGVFLAHQPHNYTQTFGDSVITNTNFINTVFAYVIPQRAFVFGLPLVLTIMLLLYLAIEKRNRWLFMTAGLVASLLPLIHTYGLLFLAISTPVVCLLTLPRSRRTHWLVAIRPWLYFVVPIFLIGLPQLLWLTHGIDTKKFFHPQYGWTKGTDSIFWFWFKNLGLLLPLLIGALFWLKPRRRTLFAMTAGAGIVFAAANLFVFQPWDWDNTKLFAYWFVVSTPAVAIMIVWLAGRSWRSRVGMALVVISMLLAGSAELAKAINWQTAKVEMFDATGQVIGATVREKTTPRDIFLTGQNPNNPFASLGGRPIVLGYTGWLWSYGIPYQDREQDVGLMYGGGPDTEPLLDRYQVRFVVIGPVERSTKLYQVNEGYFRQHYGVWQQFGPVTVYDRTVRNSGAVSAS